MLPIVFLFLNLSPREDSLLIRAVELSYQEEFARSESLLKVIINENPYHPAPYFGLASLYELMWVDLGNDSLVGKFLSYSDSSILLATAWTRRYPDDAWGYFFLGGAYTLRIFYHEIKGEILKSLPFVGPAIKWLSKCQEKNPNISDVYLGLGMWEYIKGHFPFFNSRKEKGLMMIKRASERGKYVSLYAILAHAEILIRERDFDEAILIITPIADSFTESRTLNWPLLKAYYGKKDYDNALVAANRLIDISQDNKFSYFEATYYKTKILVAMKRLKGAKENAESALEIDVDINAPNVKIMEKELKRILKEINQKMGN